MTAFALAVELGDWTRVTGNSIGAFVGLVPTEHSSGKTIRDRWELAPPAARARGDSGNRRLHERWIAFNLRRKRPGIANVAIARELAGRCWSLAVLDATD